MVCMAPEWFGGFIDWINQRIFGPLCYLAATVDIAVTVGHIAARMALITTNWTG